jgi:hypothetical protein
MRFVDFSVLKGVYGLKPQKIPPGNDCALACRETTVSLISAPALGLLSYRKILGFGGTPLLEVAEDASDETRTALKGK